MASRPNPSWSEPQRDIFKTLREAEEIVIPYFAKELPSLDNHTPEQICDELGVIKVARKAIEGVEKTISGRFKPHMHEKELRGNRYIATKRSSERVALNQGACRGLLEQYDNLGVSLTRLAAAIASGQITVPDNTKLDVETEESNTREFYSSTAVEALYVEPIA